MRAAGTGHNAVATLLLDIGADPDPKNNHGQTVLMGAAAGRHLRRELT